MKPYVVAPESRRDRRQRTAEFREGGTRRTETKTHSEMRARWAKQKGCWVGRGAGGSQSTTTTIRWRP
eukprot:4814008-Prymnesium_polylepis.1